jgi:amidophosphoribosyltransferase
MCGLIGIVGKNDVSAALYDALNLLQHRGQDAAGIATVDGRTVNLHKANGLVRDVFDAAAMRAWSATWASGTAGTRRPDPRGQRSAAVLREFAVRHRARAQRQSRQHRSLRREVFEQDRRHINTGSDSEVLLNVFAHELERQEVLRPGLEDVFRAITQVHRRCSGGYAAVALVLGLGVVAFRDPHGIRPLVVGRAPGRARRRARGRFRERRAGRARFSPAARRAAGRGRGDRLRRQPAHAPVRRAARHAPCIFEYVYLARPDSMIEDVSVYRARMRMGSAWRRRSSGSARTTTSTP